MSLGSDKVRVLRHKDLRLKLPQLSSGDLGLVVAKQKSQHCAHL